MFCNKINKIYEASWTTGDAFILWGDGGNNRHQFNIMIRTDRQKQPPLRLVFFKMSGFGGIHLRNLEFGRIVLRVNTIWKSTPELKEPETSRFRSASCTSNSVPRTAA